MVNGRRRFAAPPVPVCGGYKMLNRRKRRLLRFPDISPGAVSLARSSSQAKALAPRLRFILLICCIAVLVLSASMLIWHYAAGASEEAAFRKLAAVAAGSTQTPANPAIFSDADGPSSIPEAPAMLEQYSALYKQNADIAGWVRIDGTTIDYPVMYTGDNFYLSHGFDKEESKSGVPFIDKRCSVKPTGTNTIVYGHHMKNGTMFAGLMGYEDEDYYKGHTVIHFDTLYEQQEYEIIAVFKSQIYRKSDTAFKHYNFLSAGNEAEFDAYMKGIKALALYDTGITASYGDALLTLVTCAYHTENGQLVVVAKRVSSS